MKERFKGRENYEIQPIKYDYFFQIKFKWVFLKKLVFEVKYLIEQF